MFSLHAKNGLLRVFLLLVAAVMTGWTGQTAQGQEFLRLGESARGLAMGGALTAVADSFDAMLYNPAGLVQSTNWRFELSYWQEESKDTEILDGGNFFSQLDSLAGTSEAEVDAFLQTNAIKSQSARTQALAGFHNGTGFGIAYLNTTRLASPASPTPIQLDLSYDRISGGLMTFSYATATKILMWGVTLKSLERESSLRSLSSADIGNVPNFETEAGTKGVTEFDYDVGFLLRLPIPFFRPTLALAVMNATSPDFNGTSIQALPKETNIGIAFEPNMFREYTRLILSAEIRDNSKSAFPAEKDKRKREHFGAEFSFWPYDKDMYVVQLRAGESQGYPSLGIGVNFSRYFAIELVSYAEDIGSANVELRQRREFVQIKLGF